MLIQVRMRELSTTEPLAAAIKRELIDGVQVILVGRLASLYCCKNDEQYAAWLPFHAQLCQQAVNNGLRDMLLPFTFELAIPEKLIR